MDGGKKHFNFLYYFFLISFLSSFFLFALLFFLGGEVYSGTFQLSLNNKIVNNININISSLEFSYKLIDGFGIKKVLVRNVDLGVYAFIYICIYVCRYMFK